MTILVTGGAGFIGSNFTIDWLQQTNESVLNLDKLTYAGNINNLKNLKNDHRYTFIKGDIGDQHLVEKILTDYRPRAIINFAAESHVDRSIQNPEDFMYTNVMGTFQFLKTALNYQKKQSEKEAAAFRFLHISTDEVYGSLAPDALAFTENNRYKPNSPYSASKAASDHLVRAYHQTYGLPVLTTHCSNNYGPYQFPEKLIPLIIQNALAHKPLPIYGDGMQIRDWLYVGDHCNAIRTVLTKGIPGNVYNIGGINEKTNIEIVYTLCNILDKLRPIASDAKFSSYRELITYIDDRPGHDRRYAVNTNKITKQLGWKPTETFETGIQKTIDWYLNNKEWIEHSQLSQQNLKNRP